MQMPSSRAHRPCTSRSSSPRFSEICPVSCAGVKQCNTGKETHTAVVQQRGRMGTFGGGNQKRGTPDIEVCFTLTLHFLTFILIVEILISLKLYSPLFHVKPSEFSVLEGCYINKLALIIVYAFTIHNERKTKHSWTLTNNMILYSDIILYTLILYYIVKSSTGECNQ